MFNLESAISDWRAEMLAAGIKAPVPLDELESHLREDIAQQVKSGLNEQEACAVSARRIGPARALRQEFLKTNDTNKGVVMTRIIATITGLFGMAFGLGLILPALAKHNHHHGSWDGVLWPLLLGSAILAVGAGVAFYCIRTRREARGRAVIAVALLISSLPFFGTAIMTLLSHTSELTSEGWVVFLLALAASVAFFGSCFRFNWQQPPQHS